jgi:hypothetical protein
MRASDDSIGCCPWGQTCNGGGGVGGVVQPQPQPSTWQPQPTPQASTVYITQTHPTTTIIYAGGGGQEQTTQQVTTVYPGLVGVGQGEQSEQGQDQG